MMFCADDDDASLKIPIVRPNDVLDIEVSPLARSTSASWGHDPDSIGQRTPAKLKLKDKKAARAHSSSHGLKKQLASPMKRGDPFLPSVFPDENPIADYTVKKNSRKKPSDCKCKGFGYNLSPSALLPEEMRQQWGVGMFGKPTLTKVSNVATTNASSTPMAIAPRTRLNEPKCTQATPARNGVGCTGNSCCVLRCKTCMKDPCLCIDLSTKHDGFRIPESSERRKHKASAKGHVFKTKDNKSPGPVVLGSTNSAPVLKRIACYNSKDNSNIISTSNFHRNNLSAVTLNGHSATSGEFNSYKCGLSISQSSIGNSRCSSLNGNMTCGMKSYSNAVREDITLTPRARHRQQSVPPRRLLTSISSSPILSNGSLGGTTSSFETKNHLSRNAAQMVMLGTQGCTCDSCRRRANLMSRMEALGFSTSRAQQMLSPFLFTTSQRYHSGTLHSTLSTPGRYTPYNIPTYSYTRPSAGIYRSPERYHCSSPPYYDYSDSPGRKRQPVSSTPLSMVHEVNKLDSSYLDNENSMPSPPSSGFIEDITDLSIKDTVDFFVSMKSPIENSSPSGASDTSSGVYPPLSPGERSASPSFNAGSNSCFCSSGMCASTYPASSQRRESIFSETPNHKFASSTNAPAQPMSLLYSSLVSDLEDELRCAIENIPTS